MKWTFQQSVGYWVSWRSFVTNLKLFYHWVLDATSPSYGPRPVETGWAPTGLSSVECTTWKKSYDKWPSYLGLPIAIENMLLKYLLVEYFPHPNTVPCECRTVLVTSTTSPAHLSVKLSRFRLLGQLLISDHDKRFSQYENSGGKGSLENPIFVRM
jgi:hypothetical protein